MIFLIYPAIRKQYFSSSHSLHFQDHACFLFILFHKKIQQTLTGPKKQKKKN